MGRVFDMSEWVYDISLNCWVGYRSGDILLGMNVIGDCPGTVVGIIHPGGQEAVDKWVDEHPDREGGLPCQQC